MIDLQHFGARAVTILPDSVIRIRNTEKEMEVRLLKEMTIKGGKLTQHIEVHGEILKETEVEE